MEKRKRKSKERQFPIEFISPFSLEECISRLPENCIKRISANAYEFELKSNINDSRNQFINVYGYLQRNNTSTIVVGEGKFSPILYIIAIPAIPLITLVFSGFMGSSVVGILFVGLVEGCFTYILYRTKKQLTYSIFSTFRIIRKAKNPSRFSRHHFLLPWITLNREIDLPLDQCAAELRKLSFWPTICRVIALDENEYHFQSSGLFGNWFGIEAVGRLVRDNEYGTRIKCQIGMRYTAYWQPFFMLIMLAILSVTQPVWRSMIPFALILFIPFTALFGFINLFAFRRMIIKTLE